MKRIVCLMLSCWLFVTGFAQPMDLDICRDKTTSLVFPFKIIHVDRGSKNVMAQQVNGAGNILLVKAASENFPETNLSVITDDGTVYSFEVSYNSRPEIWVHHLPIYGKKPVGEFAENILDNPLFLHGVRDQNQGIELKLGGIYIRENVMYYQLQVINNSPIDFDIELLRFYISDNKKQKRSAIQETGLMPLHTSGNFTEVKARSQNTIVIVLKKFTIPVDKYLAAELKEKDGGRHLLLKINNQTILKAKPLPNYQ